MKHVVRVIICVLLSISLSGCYMGTEDETVGIFLFVSGAVAVIGALVTITKGGEHAAIVTAIATLLALIMLG